MKNFTLGLNVVLTIAVAVLFFLHFSSKGKTTAGNAAGSGKAAPSGNFKMAYFDMDSLEAHYDYMKDFIKDVRASEEKNNKELMGDKNAYMKAIQDYRENAKTWTEEQLYNKQKALAEMEKNLQAKQQMKGEELQYQSNKKLQEIKKTVEDFLKVYNKNKDYAFIVSNSADFNMLYYKDSAYNITDDLIKGLNEAYNKKKQ
jgi:outer membrane protein